MEINAQIVLRGIYSKIIVVLDAQVDNITIQQLNNVLIVEIIVLIALQILHVLLATLNIG